MLLIRNRALLTLFLAQALYWSCSLIGITLTALIGLQLSPYNALATLPLALLVLGNLLATHPLSLFMQRHGRRPGLTLGAAAGILGGLVSASGVWLENFVLFCLGALPIGVYQASAMYYRFAALETVDEAHKGRAAAWVIADRWYGRRTSRRASLTAGSAARYPTRAPAKANALLIVRETRSRGRPGSSVSADGVPSGRNSAYAEPHYRRSPKRSPAAAPSHGTS